MYTKNLIATSIAASLLMSSVAFAQAPTTQTATPASSEASKITCVGTAINTREQSIDTAMTTYSSANGAAYTARASALQKAYTQTTAKAVSSAVKASWTTFNSSVKSARKAWQTSRDAAWTTYRKAAAACKAPSEVNDNANSKGEVSGN